MTQAPLQRGFCCCCFLFFFTDCVVKLCVTLFNPKPIWDKIVRSFLCLLPCVYFSHLWLSHGLVELIEQADFMSILDIRLCEAKLQFHLTKSWVRLCDFFFFFFLTHDMSVTSAKCYSGERGGWFLGQDPMFGWARELPLWGYLWYTGPTHSSRSGLSWASAHIRPSLSLPLQSSKCQHTLSTHFQFTLRQVKGNFTHPSSV